jgi:hypothetical protein
VVVDGEREQSRTFREAHRYRLQVPSAYVITFVVQWPKRVHNTCALWFTKVKADAPSHSRLCDVTRPRSDLLLYPSIQATAPGL